MEVFKRNQQTLSQCYFCGEEMPPSQLEIHVKTCGCVLEPCPENCGLYVQRQYKNHHSSWCKKDPNSQLCWTNFKSEISLLKEQFEKETNQRRLEMEHYAQQIENYNMKIAKTEDLNLKLIDAITGVRKLVAEEQCARLKDVSEVRASVSEATKLISHLKFLLNQTRVDVEELRNDFHSNEPYEKLYEQFQEWKKKQDDVIQGIQAALNKDVHEEINKLHSDSVIRSKSVNDLLDLNEVIIDTQDRYTEQIYQLELDFKEFKKFLADENIMISGIWREQLEDVKGLKSQLDEINLSIKTLFDDQEEIRNKVEHFSGYLKETNNLNDKDKNNILERTISEDIIKELIDDRNIFKERLDSLERVGNCNGRTFSTDTSLSVFDDTIVKQQNEIAQRLETLEKLTTEVQMNCKKKNSVTSTNNEQNNLPVVLNELSSEQTVMKRRLEALESLTQELEEVKCKLNCSKLLKQHPVASINGRLMWTISDFNTKIEESRKGDTRIESPCFYTSENGYKLQLRAFLNGIGQWTGRHMIVSLHVLSSQWDGRLTWPCRLKVIICLRDQEPIHRKAKDIVKSFTSSPARKGFDSPCLQMFIPHRTLYTRSYLKNDVVIIDVKTLPLL